MLLDPKKEKIVNEEEQDIPVNEDNRVVNNDPTAEADPAPLAPFDPRLRKPGNEPLPANQDPLNGVNE